ncbi:MAG: signal peptidase II [Chloroflexota bacterium]|nr:signal peptidase II [Chloroflexota bacterium]
MFWPIIIGVVVLDSITKALAVRMLVPQRIPREVVGDVFRLTLVYNRGAAFGLHLGPYSRWIFLALTAVALLILYRLYRDTRPGDRLRTVAVALVCAGAIGNLIDRVRSSMGVVDFLDIGVGDLRWPTFNVADIAVSIGAFLLAWALWGEDARAPAAAPPGARVPTAKPSEGA